MLAQSESNDFPAQIPAPRFGDRAEEAPNHARTPETLTDWERSRLSREDIRAQHVKNDHAPCFQTDWRIHCADTQFEWRQYCHRLVAEWLR